MKHYTRYKNTGYRIQGTRFGYRMKDTAKMIQDTEL